MSENRIRGLRGAAWIVVVVAVSVLTQIGCSARVCPSDYQTHVAVLAGDELGGRGVGQPGIDLAAGYIAGQFAAVGIEPAGENGSYFQELEVSTGSELTDDYEFTFSGVNVSPERSVDYSPFSFSSDDEFEGEVVFAGYGIVNEEKEHDDYKDLDASGKVVLMLRREPPDWEEDGTTRHAMFRNKIYTAREQGAVAVLIVNRVEEDEDDNLRRFGGGGGGNFGVPAFHIKQTLAEALIEAGGLDGLESLQTKIDGGENASGALVEVTLRGQAGVEAKTARSRNVIGVVRGEGPLADEYIVIGGHYDHLGLSEPMRRRFGRSQEPSGPQIHNGADDNASGTAGVIECGRILARSKPLKRSVLLMAFTGEESGLIGSKYFVEHPTVPLENIVAMLNMDMIGRLDEESTIQVFGTKAALEFEEMIPRLCKKAGMAVRASESAMGPSDHTSFYQKKIPAMHFFTGLHADYHRPGDDVDKVNAEGGARVADLVVAVAREILNSPARPTYYEVTTRARIGRRSGGPGRVVMGIMPGYVDEGKSPGMLVDGVMPGGPAEEAGMKGGDQIVKIGDMEVKSVYDYMGALRNKKPDDLVQVTVLRDGEEIELEVKLVGR